jgi:hypothetical protein
MAAYTTIDDPSAFFKVQLYTGNGSADKAVTFSDTDTNMQPDMVWIKNTDTNDGHMLFDAIRGVGEPHYPNTGDFGATDSDSLDAFQSDGFRTDGDNETNRSGDVFVSWNWKAGTTGTDLTAGGIDPSASNINTTSGIGIYRWTGTGSAGTVSHGLGAVPHTLIVHQLTSTAGDTARDWAIYHQMNTAAPETDYLIINNANTTADALLWNDTAPTSSVFSIGSGAEVNQSSGTFICYAFTEKQGYSKFGKYKGNGNSSGGSGTFIYLGFRPAFFLIKNTENSGGSGDWVMWDNKQNSWTGNPNDTIQKPNDSSVGYTSTVAMVDFLSNGVKIRGLEGGIDDNGDVVVYWAFAEAPIVNSSGVPGTAV